MAARGPKMDDRGLERGLPLSFWALPLTFSKYVFDPTIPSMRKVDNREKRKKRKKKRMWFLMATNVVASRPPERQPTEMLHACAYTSLVVTVFQDEHLRPQ